MISTAMINSGKSKFPKYIYLYTMCSEREPDYP